MSNNEGAVILKCEHLAKSYMQAGSKLVVLEDVNLTFKKGETVSIMGSSGSGKSTLLHLLAGLDRPTHGKIIINNQLINHLSDKERCQFRNKNLGFVYQFHHLLPEFTALENVLMPIAINDSISPEGKKSYQKKAANLLAQLGVASRISHFPSQLSGGERQRVAIERAIIHDPLIIFADEPTGNLDVETGKQVLEVLFQLQAEFKTSIVIVTHDEAIATQTSVCYRLGNKQLFN